MANQKWSWTTATMRRYCCSIWNSSGSGDKMKAAGQGLPLSFWSGSIQCDVLVIQSKIVDAALGRRNPSRHFARSDDPLHEAMHKVVIRLAGQPFRQPQRIFLATDWPALRIGRHVRPGTDAAAEMRARQ